jgi:very-short-patch-repair endonuclease
MTKIYSRIEVKEKRRYLRQNMPKAEAIIWSHLKNKQRLGKRFLRQFSVGSFILDFYCPSLKLAIEIDGNTHFLGEKSAKYDLSREKYLNQFGITVLRYTNYDVYNSLDAVIFDMDEVISELLRKENLSKNPPAPLYKKGGYEILFSSNPL